MSSSSSWLPPQVEALVARHLGSIQQLEILLLLARSAGRPWTAADVAAELRTSPRSVLVQLEALQTAGLLARRGEPGHHDVQFQFEESTPDAGAVQELAGLYPQFRVRINQLIYRRPLPGD
jgi:hypothetical protein